MCNLDNENLLLVPIEQLPQTDDGKKEKVKVNNLQENFIFLLNKKGCSLADVQRETLIPWTTVWGWLMGSVEKQMLDINVKELATFFDVTVDELAFSDMGKDSEK